jgi:Putative DNA-binding domain
MSDVIATLAAFQRDFTAALCRPLGRATKTLVADTAAYPDALCERIRADGRARLAVYNRQYWFRLFGALQTEYRLTCALLGAWTFNEHAERFLLAHPPASHDLARICDGFAAWMIGRHGALREAITLDDALRGVLTAPDLPRLVLGPEDVPHLPRGRLVFAPTCAVIEQTRPWFVLRDGLPPHVDERRVSPPEVFADGMHAYLLVRHGATLGRKRLAPAHAQLLQLLAHHAVGDAITALEQAHGPTIAADAQRWLREGMVLGLWTELRRA